MEENNRPEDSQNQSNHPAEQTPEQYYQQYRPVNDYKPPKKSYGAVIAAAVAFFLLIITAAGAAFLFRDTLSNTYAKFTKSPVEYYSYIEKNAVKKAVSDITSNSASSLFNSGNTAFETTSDITVNRDTLDSILQSGADMSLSDLEGMLGLQLKNLGFDALIAKEGSIINESIALRLNEVKLITGELFMDTDAGELFLRLPELSKAYLNLSSQDLSGNVDLSALDKITSDRTADFLTRYSNLLIDHMKQVKLEDNAELSIDTLSSKCTKLTVTITEEDALDMISSILEEAREDDYILDILPLFGMTKEDYQTYVDDAIDEIDAAYDTITDESIDMILYVNSRGEILGRQFTIDGSDAAVGYSLLSKNNYDEYHVYFTDETGTQLFKIEGSQTKKQGAYSGDASIEISSGNESSSTISLDVSYDDLRSEKKDNITYLYGTIQVSSLDLMGLQGTMEYSVEDGAQLCKIDVQVGAMPIVTINIKNKHLEDYKVTMPAKDAQTFDINQAEDYSATFNLKDYLTDLAGKLGIDPETMDSLISEFSN